MESMSANNAGVDVPCARRQIFDFAVDVCRYRVLGGSFLDLVKRARSVASFAVAEGVPIETPITELFSNQAEYYGTETLGWQYQRAYKCADPGIDPLNYFAISYENGTVTIKSLGVAGADGEIEFNRKHTEKIFACARVADPTSYERWAHDPYPVGGFFLLQRIDDPEHGEYARMRLVAGDVHPCRGNIQFGEPQQELDQLGAFAKLRKPVLDLFEANTPTQAQRAAAAQRAKEINAKSGRSFMPSDGYCDTCGGDVTIALANIAEGANITGCPLCCRTWCD